VLSNAACNPSFFPFKRCYFTNIASYKCKYLRRDDQTPVHQHAMPDPKQQRMHQQKLHVISRVVDSVNHDSLSFMDSLPSTILSAVCTSTLNTPNVAAKLAESHYSASDWSNMLIRCSAQYWNYRSVVGVLSVNMDASNMNASFARLNASVPQLHQCCSVVPVLLTPNRTSRHEKNHAK
jgi:hypothetical protein